MKKITVFLALIFIITPVFSQYTYQELLYLPWGNGDLEAGFCKAPGGQYGPMSFAVKNDSILFLDSQNGYLKIFKNNSLLDKIKLPTQGAIDFILKKLNHYFLLSDNKLLEFSNAKQTNSYNPDSPQTLITSLIEGKTGNIFVVLNEINSVLPVSGKQLSATGCKGIISSDAEFVQVIKKDLQTITIRCNNSFSFNITSTKPNLGSAKFLGSTTEKNLYIYLEKIIQQIPLQVEREIRLYSIDGVLKARFLIPTHAHTYIFKEFFVDDKGNLFRMISAKDGVYITGWYRTTKTFENTQTFNYPEKFQQFYHYNQIEEHEAEPSKNIHPKFNKKKDKCYELSSVTRDEALAIGDTYVQHRWTAAADNLTNGRITDPNGVTIETPTWIQIGENIKIPYKWGGFSTIAGFDEGLLNGKYAGDKYTSKSSGSSYCVGVDCSGFVSRCWKLSSHYSTRMMDDYIAVAYSSWDQLLPGDAVHKPGHVRLFVSFNPNGSLLVVEATAKTTFWRVGYFSYNLSDLTAYTPRYYINMEGMPASIPQPELVGLSYDDSVQVSWQIDKSESIAGFHIFTCGTDADWIPFLNGKMFSPDKTSTSFALLDNTPLFYRMNSVSSSGDSTESFPSDAYGYFHTGSDEKILIVDGFDRTDGSYPFPYHTFAMSLGNALNQFDYSYETISNEAVIDASVQLKNYAAVIWLLGDESTDEETFNSTEQNLIKTYLQQGGKMFITGSEVAWDLDYMGDTGDKNFIHNFLMTEYDLDDSESYTVTGVNGTLFEGLTLHYDDGTKGVYEEDWPDAFKTINSSYAALNYSNGLIAATAFEGVVPAGTKPAKILLMGFPFETIYNESERIDLIDNVLTFFDFSSNTFIHNTTDLPQKFVLYKNYPNPFNSGTIIRYQLPYEERVVLKIFNVLGEEIRVLTNKQHHAGIHKTYWDGCDENGRIAASGMYIYQIQIGAFVKSRKMMVIR